MKVGKLLSSYNLKYLLKNKFRFGISGLFLSFLYYGYKFEIKSLNCKDKESLGKNVSKYYNYKLNLEELEKKYPNLYVIRSQAFNNLLDDYTCQVWASSNYPVSDGFTYYSESRDVIDPQYIWRSDENSQQSISIFIPNFQSLGNVRYLKLVIDLPDDFWLHPQTLGYFEIYTATDSFDFPYYNIFDYANQEGFNCKFIYEYDIWEDISRIYPIVGNGDYTELYD